MVLNEPLKVELGNVTEQNALQLKVINTSALPVRYTDKFYRELVEKSPPDFLKFAFWNGFAVGAVCSRLEPHSEPGTFKIYIMTIAVLPAYRRRGIASTLLNHILDLASRNPSVKEVYLHVQTRSSFVFIILCTNNNCSNEDARQFYLHHQFEQGELIENYYKRIDPPHGYIFRKPIIEHKVVGETKPLKQK